MTRTLVAAALAAILCAPNVDAREPGWHTMKSGIVGCRDREEFERISSIRYSRDREAFEKAATAGITSGRCAILDKGTEVYIEDVAMFAGVARVRARGQTAGYWIYYELLD